VHRHRTRYLAQRRHSVERRPTTDFLFASRIRRLERAVVRAARQRGFQKPDVYAVDAGMSTHNCLDPVGLAIFYALPKRDVPAELTATARRMCESVARSRRAR
jgi:hypothetical protein